MTEAAGAAPPLPGAGAPSAPPTVPPPPATRLAAIVDDVLFTGLIVLRPLAWDGDPGNVANIVWSQLVLLAAGQWLFRAWRLRLPCRLGPTGLALAAFAALLVPALVRAPLPVAGWTLWTMLLIHLVFAFYALQVIPGRARLALAALGAGVAVEAALAFGQWRWSLPAMIAAQKSGADLLPGMGVSGGDIAERLANGGVFGTFTISNHLAAFFALALPPLLAAAGIALRARLPSARPALALLAALTLLVLFAARHTHAKGVALACALALLGWWIAWWCAPARRLRAPVLAMTALALAGAAWAVWTWPPAHAALVASRDVRLGYWRGAVALIREHPIAGSGLGAFEAYAPAAMPSDAEPARHAHNELLETAVEAGIPIAALFAAVLTAVVWRAARGQRASTSAAATDSAPVAASATDTSTTSPWPAAIAAGLATLGAGTLGAYDGNVTTWPGGASAATVWTLVLALLAAATTSALARLPPPPRAALAVGLATCFLGALLDFSLHVGALVGGAVVLACIAAPARSAPTSPSRWPLWTATAFVLAVFALSYLRLMTVVPALDQAHDLIETAHLAGSGNRDAQDRLANLADDLGAGGATDGRVLIAAAGVRAETLAGDDLPTRLNALALSPAGADRLPRSRALAETFPFSAGAWSTVAADEHALAIAARQHGDRAAAALHTTAALDAERRALARTPWNLDAHLGCAALLDDAATDLPDQASSLHAEAQQQHAFVETYTPIVNPRNLPHGQ